MEAENVSGNHENVNETENGNGKNIVGKNIENNVSDANKMTSPLQQENDKWNEDNDNVEEDELLRRELKSNDNNEIEENAEELENIEEDVKRYYVSENDDAMCIEEDYIDEQDDTVLLGTEISKNALKRKSDELSGPVDDDFHGFDVEPYDLFEIKQINKRLKDECIRKKYESQNENQENKSNNYSNKYDSKKETTENQEKTINSRDNVSSEKQQMNKKNVDSVKSTQNVEQVATNKSENNKRSGAEQTVAVVSTIEQKVDKPTPSSRYAIYRKPLLVGWKRELVLRANPSSSKDKGEAYYITPAGKKLRTKSEIMQHLTPGLSIENFTFVREPLGFDPSEEIIRSAKLKSTSDQSLLVRKTPTDNNLGKRVPKPKAPKGASPPPQGWTPTKAVKSASIVMTSPRSTSNAQTKNSDDIEIKTNKSIPKSNNNKQTKKGEPCTIQCVLAMGIIPQLQCVKCLCLYHHECIENTEHNKSGNDDKDDVVKMSVDNCNVNSSLVTKDISNLNTPYICETCKNNAITKTSLPSSSGATIIPLSSAEQQNNTSSTKHENSTTSTVTSSKESQLKNSSAFFQNPDQNAQKTSICPITTASSTLPTLTTSSSSETNPAYDISSNISNPIKNKNNINVNINLAQSMAVIKGRKYVVVPKAGIQSNALSQSQQSVDNNMHHISRDENLHTDVSSAGISMSSKKGVNVRHKISSSLPSTSIVNQQQTSVNRSSFENFTTNYFGNVSIGYDILLHIFQYLKVQELLRAACVCRMWNVVANHRSLWKTVRMKNSQINNWTGLTAVLKRNETKHLDLRKMLISNTNGDEMWKSFSENIQNVTSLEAIDLCRCSSSIVENLFKTNPNLKILNAITIKDEKLNLENFCNMENLQELRLKSVDGCTLESDLSTFKELKNLKHLSLTSFHQLGTKKIGMLGELICLETLELGDCTEFDQEFVTDVLPKLTKLERLRLEKGHEPCCTLNILEAISNLPNLTQLELINFDVRTGFDEKLSQCKNLKKLLLIPTYVSQSATTNNIVLKALLNLSNTLRTLTWVVTLELLRVTALYVLQCDDKKKDNKVFDESIPVLKPVPSSSSVEENPDKVQKTTSEVPQVEILPLAKVEKILSAGMPDTKFKILKVPCHATWRQNLVENQ